MGVRVRSPLLVSGETLWRIQWMTYSLCRLCHQPLSTTRHKYQLATVR